jgi:hypothetical protein
MWVGAVAPGGVSFSADTLSASEASVASCTTMCPTADEPVAIRGRAF